MRITDSYHKNIGKIGNESMKSCLMTMTHWNLSYVATDYLTFNLMMVVFNLGYFKMSTMVMVKWVF